MKAQVLYGINNLRYEEVDKPVPDKGEVVLKVEAVGICGSDVPRICETGAHIHPIIPGHEFAGTVSDIGSNNEYTSMLGRRFGVFPLIPCGKCMPCKNKQYEMCRNYNYLGSRCDGGFAEYVKVPMGNLIELPDVVSYEDAAMLEPTSVAMHAIRRCFGDGLDKVFSDKNIVVIGLGTIGLLTVMLLLSFGMENIYVIGNKRFQYEKVTEMGLRPENYYDVHRGNIVEWVAEKTLGNGADYVFECVGRNETYSMAIDIAAPASKVVLIGNPYSDMILNKGIYWKILRNQIEITGSWNSSFTGEENDDWHFVINKIANDNIRPSILISHRFNLSRLQDGLDIMKNKREDYGKIMLCR